MVRKFRPVRGVRRIVIALSVGAAVAVAMPGSFAGATSSSSTPTLKQLLAEAAKISYQIDALGQEYDSLRIQFHEAKAQVKIALQTVRLDDRVLTADQTSIAKIAAAGYMAGGINPTLQLLESATRRQCWTGRPSSASCSRRTGPDQPGDSRHDAAERASVMAGLGAGDQAVRGHARQGGQDPGQGRRAQQRPLRQGPGGIPADGHYPDIHLNGDRSGYRRCARR